MACLWCQKSFNEHTRDELLICVVWIQNRMHEIAENYRKLFEAKS
jgi:hypothetical protein